MNRNVSLVLSIIHYAKLPAVRALTDSVEGLDYRYTWGPSETLGYVQLDTKDLDANGEAYAWIADHPDIHVVDTITEDPGPKDNGTTEYLVVRLRDWRIANARRNAAELTAKIGKRRAEARKDIDTAMTTAMNVDFHLGKIVQWEAERDAWKHIAERGEFREVFAAAVVDLINGLGNSADALEDALRTRQLNGLRTFVRRARVYMDDQDAVNAFLSF